MTGLDIGSYSIKAVELQKDGGSLTLANFKIQKRLPQEPLQAAVKKILEELRPSSKEVNLSISGHLTLVRLIEIPEISEAELKNAVKFEAERFISFSIDDAILDYQIVAKNPSTKKITVLLAAAKKDLVKNHMDMVSKAGFTVKAVDIDGLALTNAFLNAYPEKANQAYEKAFGLLNIGDSVLNIIVIHKGIPFVLRDIGGAGRELSETIVKSFAIEKEEAYKLKHDPPPDRQGQLSDLLKPAFGKFARDIELSIGYFENQFSKSVDCIYLSGGSARLFKLKEFISESLEMPVDLWDPFASIKTEAGDVQKSLEDVRQELGVAAGLAVRDV
ncbi:MAG: type IV pilus assembly protein PilM [Candidatus Omnitrophica bacterium]|nr:type IV pilus assembly protein PilM [Candidatus Omnitrophota bacterium]